MRPANLVTSVADVLAGATISVAVNKGSAVSSMDIILVCLSTIGLYGGGVVFNDVFDATLDAVERPERPIPSGLITKTNAVLLGLALLIPGIMFAFLINQLAGIVALFIALLALVYDKWSKHQSLPGPINMGACRGLNLMLGVSLVPVALAKVWLLAFVPVVYIAAITITSRGEVHGGKPAVLYATAVLYSLVLLAITAIALQKKHIIETLPFLLLFASLITVPLSKAIRQPIGKNIGKAVKAGVISLILMDACWASAFGSFYTALIILLLLPLSLWLAKLFAVT